MTGGGIIIFDIGKTHAKLSLWDSQYNLIAKEIRANEICESVHGYQMLDIYGIEAWLIDTLTELAKLAPVESIVTVAHGAAAVLIENGRIWTDPLDYEQDLGPAIDQSYNNIRPDFEQTGSPRLPLGLNLGCQLFFLENLVGPFPDNLTILLWPQFWSFKLSGVAASEVTSLGCHSDLWNPHSSTFSRLALERGWDTLFPPMRLASNPLGTITEDISSQTGLPSSCQVLCGIHDSNAALLSARTYKDISDGDLTTLSTGTWFVAMRCLRSDQSVDSIELQASRDCLINVDSSNRPVPSARFMGGREYELAEGIKTEPALLSMEDPELAERLGRILAKGQMLLPGLVQGTGPFPDRLSSWLNKSDDELDNAVAVQFYLALMSCTILDMIGSRDHLLLEGRFALIPAFARVIATLRSTQRVYISRESPDMNYGALKMACPDFSPRSDLEVVEPLALDVSNYANDWHAASNPHAEVHR